MVRNMGIKLAKSGERERREFIHEETIYLL